ncbi:MAG: hypothetical protein IJG24_06810 [Selenomonadaceae bacterium]|nr:hypothetical protein [Selenomonadaceae bacterium]
MFRPIVRSNPPALLASLMARGMTVTEGAKAAGVDRFTLDTAIRAARPLTVKTASKLKAAFGDAAVTMLTPAQLELNQLENLREEFKNRYPEDTRRLKLLDEMIADARARMEGETQ